MNDIIWRSVKKAQYPAVKEPVGLSQSNGKDRMGQRWSHGREGSRWLGTWPSQIRLRTLILARRRRERQQQQTERRKTKRQSTPIWPRRTISCQSQSRQVVPGMNWLWSSSRSKEGIETGGAWNELALEFITEQGRRISGVTQKPRETQFLFQRLSTSLLRGNAVAFKNTFSFE